MARTKARRQSHLIRAAHSPAPIATRHVHSEISPVARSSGPEPKSGPPLITTRVGSPPVCESTTCTRWLSVFIKLKPWNTILNKDSGTDSRSSTGISSSSESRYIAVLGSSKISADAESPEVTGTGTALKRSHSVIRERFIKSRNFFLHQDYDSPPSLSPNPFQSYPATSAQYRWDQIPCRRPRLPRPAPLLHSTTTN